MRMVQHAKELLADVARHRADLIGLRADLDITPDRMKKCAPSFDDLESAIAEILTVPCVPRTIPELTSSIASVRMNIRCVHEQVDECIDDVIERGRMDEYLKLRRDFDGQAGVGEFCRAFLWQNGVMTDLNSLVIPGSTSLYLVFGNDINSRGEIAAYAFDQNTGEFQAALAIPCDDDGSACTENTTTLAPATGASPKVSPPKNVRKLLQKRMPFGPL